MNQMTIAEAGARLEQLCRLESITIPFGTGQVRAIFGAPTTESSFKSILGLGLLVLARERGDLAPGQGVVESTSGSLGVGLAYAGSMLGHPVDLVSDINIPAVTLRKLKLLGARVHLAEAPHPELGMQQSRDMLLGDLIERNPGLYWTRQNDSDLNPEVYRRWLMPHIGRIVSRDGLQAGCFVVGSGGHFTAFAELLHRWGLPSFVADRDGSITFGGRPGPTVLRGTGNQNRVPLVIQRAMPLVAGVIRFSDLDAIGCCRELAEQGLFVGGSAGGAYFGCKRLLEQMPDGAHVLTFFPDRGEIYPNLF